MGAVGLCFCETFDQDGLAASVPRDSALAKGVNTLQCRVTCEAVAEALGFDQVPVEEALAA